MRTFSEYVGGKLPQAATVGVFHEGRLLLLRRGATAPWKPLHYGLPGGGVDEGESPGRAAARELSEETGLSLPMEAFEVVTEIESNLEDSYVNHVHVAFAQNPEVNLNYEHDKYEWCEHDECLSLQLVPNLDKIVSKFRAAGFFDKSR